MYTRRRSVRRSQYFAVATLSRFRKEPFDRSSASDFFQSNYLIVHYGVLHYRTHLHSCRDRSGNPPIMVRKLMQYQTLDAESYSSRTETCKKTVRLAAEEDVPFQDVKLLRNARSLVSQSAARAMWYYVWTKITAQGYALKMCTCSPPPVRAGRTVLLGLMSCKKTASVSSASGALETEKTR